MYSYRSSAVCVTRIRPSRFELLRNYRTTATTQSNYHCDIVEAATATAATPVYFKHVTFKRSGEAFTGGDPATSNPTSFALAEKERIHALRDKPIGCIISIGTGDPRLKGVLRSPLHFLKTAFDMLASSEATALAFISEDPGHDLYSANRYFRFNVLEGAGKMKLDNFEQPAQMREDTVNELSRQSQRRKVQTCVRSLRGVGI